jgi:hypothetical protein
VCDVFEMADGSEHGEHGLHDHPGIPGFGLADFDAPGIGLFGVEAVIGQDNHLVFKGPEQTMKDSIMYIGGVTIPTTNQTLLVEQATDFAAYHPTTVRVAFFPDLPGTANFPARMQPFYTIAVYHPKHRGLRQKTFCPGSIHFEQAKQAGSFPQFRKPLHPIPLQPAIAGSITYSFERK